MRKFIKGIGLIAVLGIFSCAPRAVPKYPKADVQQGPQEITCKVVKEYGGLDLGLQGLDSHKWKIYKITGGEDILKPVYCDGDKEIYFTESVDFVTAALRHEDPLNEGDCARITLQGTRCFQFGDYVEKIDGKIKYVSGHEETVPLIWEVEKIPCE